MDKVDFLSWFKIYLNVKGKCSDYFYYYAERKVLFQATEIPF